jgi:hypothetical protein
MQVRVHCPGCHKKLAIPARLAGKVLRCPGCQLSFRCPAAAGPAPAAAPPAAASPRAAPQAAASTSPFDFTNDAAASPDKTVPAGAWSNLETPSAQGAGWGMVRWGIGLAYGGLILTILSLLVGLGSGGAFVASIRNAAVATKDAPPTGWGLFMILALVLGILAGLLFGFAGLLSLIGQLLCCAVPRGMAARLCIWGSTALMLLSFVVPPLISAIGSKAATEPLLTLPTRDEGQSVPETEPGKEEAPPDIMAQVQPYAGPALAFLGVAQLAGMGGNLLSWLLWVLYLRQLACLFNHQRLARGVVIFLVFMLTWPLFFGCASGVLGVIVWLSGASNPNVLPWVLGTPTVAIAILLVTSILWYLITLGRVRGMLRRAAQATA